MEAPQKSNGPSRKQLTGLRKRQQIIAANKMIFVWIIIASIAVSTSLVTSQFLFEQLQFNQKVISERDKARDTLAVNLDNAETLRSEAQALVGNEALQSVTASNDSSELQVVFDALPTTPDRTAFASSLQTEILPRSGVTLSELSINEDVMTTDVLSEAPADGAESGSTIGFVFEVAGSYEQISQTFKNLDASIRPIEVTSITLQGNDDNLSATVTGVTYYQPEISIQPTKETLKP